MNISRRTLIHFSIFTILGMSAAGLLIIASFHDKSTTEVLFGGKQWYVQIGIGAVYGLATSIIALMMVGLPMLKETNRFFQDLIKSINPTFIHILFYSACAAIGEEILFRGAIQPIIGIWFTSVIFVLLHGYLNPGNLPLSLYGVFLVIVVAGFGYLYKLVGLGSAVMAHFVYDVIMFSSLKYRKTKDPNPT
ncbi:MAG: CPBP family intramembrane metalloprotease [Chitinophagales bacterium]|nr:CPBP family intramembrane metalloprotease [Chitinophagales bacterium]